MTTPLDPAAWRRRRACALPAGLWPAGGTDKKDERAPAQLGALASGRVDALADAAQGRQAPGTTRALAGPGVKEQEERERDAPEAPAPAIARDQIGAFEALQSLNRAADDRAERKQKVARVSPKEVYGASKPEAELDSSLAIAGVPSAPAAKPSAPPARPLAKVAPPAPAAAAAAPVRAPAEPARLRITFDPMVGVAAQDALVLYRTVLVGERGYRQGLVLDRAALGTGWRPGSARAASPSRSCFRRGDPGRR